MNSGNSRLPQDLEAAPAVLWVGIDCTGYDAPDAGRADGVCAGRRASVGAARFKCHEKRRAFGLMSAVLRITKRIDFRMRLSCPVMPALTDDFALLDQYRPDHGVG